MLNRVRQLAAQNRVVRLFYRFGTVFRSRGAITQRPRQSLRYVFRSRDVMHFTYELANEEELVQCLSRALTVPAAQVEGLFSELKTDGWLQDAIGEKLRAHRRRDGQVHFGYRLATYATCRLVHPGIVAELGTHDGLQSAMLLRALEKNDEEGRGGSLLSFDSNAESGWLIPDELRSRFVHVVGDLAGTLSLALAEHGVDFLMQDVGYAYPGNRAAYMEAANAARGKLIVFAEVDDETDLFDVANDFGADYHSFREQPEDHFWHGQRWGVARFEKRAAD